MNTDFIKEIQEHVKRLDSEITKYREHVTLLEGSRQLLQRNVDYLQQRLTVSIAQPEDTVVNYVGFEPGEEPLEDLRYTSHDSLHLNVELFQFHRKEDDMVYGVYNNLPIIVDTCVQIFCHFATFDSTTMSLDKARKGWLKAESIPSSIFYGFKTVASKDATGAVTGPYPGTIFKISVLNEIGGLMIYQRPGYDYYGTELTESPTGQGFCTVASLKHPTI